MTALSPELKHATCQGASGQQLKGTEWFHSWSLGEQGLTSPGMSDLTLSPLPAGPSMPEADFGRLQEEVSWYVKKAQLLEDVGAVVFSSILAMLGDREALEGLEDKVRGSHST